MRILVFGAGVLGCNLASELYRRGKDVTLLARGSWYEEIRKNGLSIRHCFGGTSRVRIPAIRELAAEDRYDAIFVAVRCTQIGSVIPVLRANVSKNVVFVGNNLSAGACAESLRDKNVLFAFYTAAGHREKDRVVSISLRKITAGPLKGDPSGEALIREIFRGTNVKAKYEPNMEDYLLCHAAFVLPICFACYFCGGNLKTLRNDKAYLDRIIDANTEGYAAIEGAGHTILPASDRDFRSAKYRRLCRFVYKAVFSTGIGKICISDHALNAVEEMSALNERLKAFFDEHRAEVPAYRKLERDAGAYLRVHAPENGRNE